MLCFKLGSVEPFKHFPEVGQVLFDGVRKHQDVIQIHHNTLVQQILKSSDSLFVEMWRARS